MSLLNSGPTSNSIIDTPPPDDVTFEEISVGLGKILSSHPLYRIWDLGKFCDLALYEGNFFFLSACVQAMCEEYVGNI